MSANFAYTNTRDLEFILQEWLPTEQIFNYPRFVDYYSKDDIKAFLNPILQRYNWPGNVRELRNVIEHGVVFAEGKTITPECLPQRFFQIKLADKPNDLRNQELQHINKVLEEHNGNISKAARALGITRSTLYRKIEQMKTLSNN
jgi:transcriptional regulator with PAS, ATPase and Fis domain